jgi:N-acetylglucosaminyldiphosphoundecaprenol N-acetyl-beta-D-mannosaminyltransferase
MQFMIKDNLKNQVEILGIKIDNVSVDDILNFIETSLNERKKILITYVNIHAVNLAHKYNWFQEFINHSDLVFCDGFGIILGAKVIGQKLEYRSSPPDWIANLCELAEIRGWRIFFLGSELKIVNAAAGKLIQKFPNLTINVHDGYFSHFGKESEMVIDQINAAKTDILLVGMGMPLQEMWIMENYKKLNVNLILPVGAMFDYVSEATIRGPIWLTNNGFEWLSRLIIEPKRLWRRYIIGNPLFFLRLLKAKLLFYYKEYK